MKTYVHRNRNIIILAICLLFVYIQSVKSQVTVPDPVAHLAFDTDKPGYESVSKSQLGTTTGNFQRTKDRYGNNNRAVKFSGRGSGVGLTGFHAENAHTLSFWIYISDPSYIPSGAIPFTDADPKYELCNWVNTNNFIVRGIGRQKATVGFNRYILKSDGSKVPWYLWSYKPAQFDEEGWYHIFVVQGLYYTRLVMYKPSSIKAYSYTWLAAQDFSGNKFLYVGGFGQHSPPDSAFDDVKVYNSELSDDQIDAQHYAEFPMWTYLKIKNKNSDLLARVQSASMQDGALIVQGGVGLGNDEWRITSSGNNECRIKNLRSEKLMVVKDASMQAGADIIQYDERGTDNEVWILENVIGDTKYFRLRNKKSGKYLAVYQDSQTDNQKLIQADGGAVSVYWSFVESLPNALYEIEDGLYRLKNKKSGKYLTVKDKSEDQNASLVQRSKESYVDIGDIDFSVWRIFNAMGDNSWYLMNAVTDLFVTSNGNQTQGDNIFQSGFVDTKVCRWQLMPTGEENEYRLKNSMNYYYAVVKDASTAENANIIQYPLGGTDNEVWILERVYYDDPPIKDATYKIRNDNSSQLMVVKDASTAHNTPIIQYSTGTKNAMWKLMHQKFGYVTLTNVNSDKDAVVYNAGLGQGDPLVQSAQHKSTGLWRVKKEFYDISGTTVVGYNLRNMRSGMIAVVKDASVSDGAPIIQYSTGTKNGLWHFEKQENLASTRSLDSEDEGLNTSQLSVLVDCKNDIIQVNAAFEFPTELIIKIVDVAGRQVYEGRKKVIAGTNSISINQFNRMLNVNQFYIISIKSADGRFNYSTKSVMER